ncbi:ABC transporter permease [Paenibacillus urinalis]|uniref:ABC transporter permease n=1 Tax=Paenibacillus urinalis TaxID=521520 RepID=A0AAX3MVF2_9BACL|nr:ABC transporter permease [Paenibacillus urinalis]WDH81388.1 ABC transporter permease [Paenibacillus urinalis]
MSNTAKFKSLLSVSLTVIALLALWQLCCMVFGIPEYLLPTPLNIVERMAQDWQVLLRHSGITIVEILAGFALSVGFGVPFAIIIVYSKYFSRSFFPIMIGLQCVPMISLTPLLITWLGFGMVTKVIIAFLIAFFPIIVNSVVGLRSSEKEMLMLAQSMKASTFQVFMHFRLPKALPSIFGGLKVGITLAVVGAVVAEFVSSDRGLGYLQLAASANLDITMQFCVVVMLAVIGLIFYNLVGWIERAAIPWYRAARGGE